MSRKIFLMIYYLLAGKLPQSCFPGGNYYNRFRTFVLRRIIQIGNNCKVQKNVYIGNGNDIFIGSNCQINENVKLDNVRIGNYVMIARNSTFLGKMHKFDDVDIPMICQGQLPAETTIVEDDVWIGTNAVIMPGVTIRTGSIVGAGAVLTKSTECNGIYGGVPAKLIRFRNVNNRVMEIVQ